MGFSIEQVGDAFKGNKKGLMIGAVGVVVVVALYARSKRKQAESESVVLSGYPQAPQGGSANPNGATIDDVKNLAGTFNQTIQDFETKNAEAIQKSNELWGQRLEGITNQFTEEITSLQDKLITQTQEQQQLVTSMQTQYDQKLAGVQQQVQSGLTQFAQVQAQAQAVYTPTLSYSGGGSRSTSSYDSSPSFDYRDAGPSYDPKPSGSGKSVFQIEAEHVSNASSQLRANGEAYNHASSDTERQRLHDENVRIGASIGATYDSGKGEWTKNGIVLN